MRSSFMRAMLFQSTNKFLPCSRWFPGSLEFLTDQFGDLSLKEPESSEVTGSGTAHLPLALNRVSLASEAQHKLGIEELGETKMDSIGNKSSQPPEKSAKEIQREAEEEIA
jgi:hypothetical protein